MLFSGRATKIREHWKSGETGQGVEQRPSSRGSGIPSIIMVVYFWIIIY
jgi:hypothetical protein